MPKEPTSDNQTVAEFDLKHRVTGAAVLLFFGALVLPWLLGPPSEASKIDPNQIRPTATNLESTQIEPLALGDNQSGDLSEIEETVYVSKITPLDAQRDKELVAAANKAKDADSKKTQSDKTSDSDKKAESDRKIAADKKAKRDAELAARKKADADKQKQVLAKKDKEKRELEQREKELQAALKAEAEANKKVASAASKVDVGWVVQVGLFTEKSRALALISELKNKGFSASNSVVDTNRGPKTGTRVWLGPFAKRSAAFAEQKRLKSKAGKDGFIRVYP